MTLRAALDGIDGLRFLSPSEREEQVASTGYEAKSIEAETVGGEEFGIYDVPIVERTGFTHFLDGAQRSWQALFHRLSPVYLSHTSAAILRRVDSELLPPDERSYRGGLEAFVPDDAQLEDALRPFVSVIAVNAKDTHPGGLDEVVRQAISDRRDAHERELAQRFGPPNDPKGSRLLIDGGLGNALRLQGEQPFVIGLVKSHRKQYFRSANRTDLVMGMRPGQRSSLFVRPADREQGESVYSFYLRLHASEAAGPLFGIVRIEMPADSAYAEAVDEVAGWILHERAPLSLPDPRSDRLLYPIRLVEQHLKARQPSTAAIIGLIG